MVDVPRPLTEQVIRVLLVEPLELVRRSISRALEMDPAIVVAGEAATLDEVIPSYDQLAPDVTVLAADLPDTRPADAVERLRRHDPGACIVLMVGFPQGSEVRRAVEAGVRACLTYAASMAEITQAIRTVHAGGTSVDQEALTALFEHMNRRRDASDSPEGRLRRLTAQERRVLAMLAEGMPNHDIATKLSISPQTVRTHSQRILAKLGVHSRLEAVAFVNANRLTADLVAEE